MNNQLAVQTITVTILLENSLWVGIFERNDKGNYAVARKIFGDEPTDPELYDYISHHYQELKYSQPQQFKLIIKRKNPKRMRREVKKLMEKAKTGKSSSTYAQEVLRLELEQHKTVKKSVSRAEKEAQAQEKFQLKQAKKKQKHRGH